MPALTVSRSIVGTTMGRTFSAVPYTYLKRGVYYFVMLCLSLYASTCFSGNWNQKSISSPGIKVEGQLSTEVLLAGNKPAPSVILSHGGGGKWEHQIRWAKTLNKNGFHAIIIDHFTQRNVMPHVGKVNPKTLPKERVKDLVKVAKWVSQQSWNQDKIGVIGFSQGGSGANLLANTREVTKVDGIQEHDLALFGAIVSYYPGCAIAGGTPPDLPYVPTIVHIAMNDGLADPFWCQSGYRKNENLTIYKYENAPHSFDVEVPGWRKTGIIPAVNRPWVAERHEPSNTLSRKRTLSFLKDHL